VEVDVEVEDEVGLEVDLGLVRKAIAAAVTLGLADHERPIPFGLQPVLEVNLVLTGDARIHELNRDYRGMDKPTDVLSFSQIEGVGGFVAAPSGRLALGDVVISVDTAARQAAEQGHSLQAELNHLAVHGALHLLGYDHEVDGDEAHMNEVARQALGG
jgi:probable rRNA maturation factor